MQIKEINSEQYISYVFCFLYICFDNLLLIILKIFCPNIHLHIIIQNQNKTIHFSKMYIIQKYFKANEIWLKRQRLILGDIKHLDQMSKVVIQLKAVTIFRKKERDIEKRYRKEKGDRFQYYKWRFSVFLTHC